MAEATNKVCRACRIDKAANEFSPDRRSSDGLQARCRACCSAAKKAARDANLHAYRAKERAYVKANKERVYANNNAWREAHPILVKQKKLEWYAKARLDPSFLAARAARAAANKDRKREYDKAYRALDPAKALERAKAWRKANPEKRAAIIRAYDARRRAQTAGGVSTRDLAAWTKAAKKVCYWCGRRCAKSYHVDHYKPLSRGGAHELENLVIACAPCNLKKNAKDPLDFAREVGRLL